MNVDSALLDPSEARDNRSKGIYDGNKDQESEELKSHSCRKTKLLCKLSS